jgi:hypothetical protein
MFVLIKAIIIKLNVKFTLKQAIKAQRGNEGTLSLTSMLDGIAIPPPHYLPWRDPVPTVQEAGWAPQPV